MAVTGIYLVTKAIYEHYVLGIRGESGKENSTKQIGSEEAKLIGGDGARSADEDRQPRSTG